MTADYLPNRNRTVELRARVFAEEVFDPTPRWIFTLSGFAEGLLARRGVEQPPGHTDVATAIVRVQEASARFTTSRFDLLAGFSRVVWGRLDEVQPTDVVNPLDVSRFFFEGRSEARLPVGLIRARAFLSESATIEGVYVPFFRRGRFDQLDEPTSPFNIEPSAGRLAWLPIAPIQSTGAAGGVPQRARRSAIQRNHRPPRLERFRVSWLRAVRIRHVRSRRRSCVVRSTSSIPASR